MTLDKITYRLDYSAYINSDLWRNKKIYVKNIYIQNNWPISCVKCNTNRSIELHHNYYNNLGDEDISNLDYLCNDCHNQWHVLQKLSNKTQNNSTYSYYDFIYKDKEYKQIMALSALVISKITNDEQKYEQQISEYFRLENVKKYEYINTKIMPWLSGLVWLFIFLIIPLIVFLILNHTYKEPADYKIFIGKKKYLTRLKELKNYIIRNYTLNKKVVI